jgi:CRP/FNR family cyclic AMP-dependent transcriptional regulator
MASKGAQLEALSAVPLFAGCSKRELTHVAKAGTEVTKEAGSVVVDQGQMGREAFVILEGTVDIERAGRKITSLGTGDVVGELALLDHGPRTASVVCVTDCSLFVLDQRHFREVLEKYPSIALKLLGTLAERIREFDRKYYG